MSCLLGVNRRALSSLAVAMALTIPPHYSKPCTNVRLASLPSVDPRWTEVLPVSGAPYPPGPTVVVSSFVILLAFDIVLCLLGRLTSEVKACILPSVY